MRGSGGGSNRKPDGERVSRGGARNAARPRVVNIGRAKGQPDLPERHGGWPEPTLDWWDVWGRSPLTSNFIENDWSELIDTAFTHAMIYDPDTPGTVRMKALAEVRQRVANFGATPLDRQRLRIQLVFAEEAERKRDQRPPAPPVSGSRARRGPYIP